MSQPNLNEDLNIVANSNIEITLMDGDLNIIQKLDDEPNDVGGLTSAELKAKFDEAGNTIKTYINDTLIPEILTEEATEAARAAAEAQREANETQRIENENVRIEAEQSRITAEQSRASAETARDAAEQARVAAEQARADETSGIVSRATEQANIASREATSAGNSASAAANSESAAASSASSAAGSALAASSSESNAKASETAASASEAAAKASETAAKSSETTAKSEADRAKSEADRAAEVVGGDFATKTEAQGYVSSHNTSKSAHADIRQAVSSAASAASAAQQTADNAIPASEKGAANGVATLGEDSKVPAEQLPDMDYAPSTHASQHASGGADPITPDAIGAAAVTHSHAAGDITSGTFAAARIPGLAASKITSGTLAVARGGTGKSSVTSGNFLVGNGTGAMTENTPAQVLSAIGAAPVASPSFTGTPKAPNGTDYTTARVRNIQASTKDLTAGSSSLSNGDIYLVYE